MRFALRKQDKIKEVLGNEYLENNILQSLNKYFENSDNDRIYSDIEPDGYVTDYGNKYPLLRINDVANSDAMLEFAVMGQMYDVLNYELEYIQHVIKPRPKQCYRNSHLLCEAFPERILYCEGKTNVPIPIDHAFNKVGDAYIDITFEFALHENPSIYEYVTFGEYDAKTIRKAVLETGYYGEIYKWLYYQSKK